MRLRRGDCCVVREQLQATRLISNAAAAPLPEGAATRPRVRGAFCFPCSEKSRMDLFRAT